MLSCACPTFRRIRGSPLPQPLALRAAALLAGHHFMPTRIAPPSPERRAAVLDEAMRRIDAAIPGEVDLGALRRALETEMAKNPCPLVKLMKVGRRRALDRISRTVRKDAD